MLANENESPPKLSQLSALSSSSDENHSIMKRPDMRVLHDIVIPRIAAHWSMVADNLEYELEFKQLIQKQCNGNILECCVMLLEDWLSSKRGVMPKSWQGLIRVLRKIKILTSATEKIEKDLKAVGIQGL